MVLSRQQKGDLHSSPCTAIRWAASEVYMLGITLLQVGEHLFILCSTNTFTKPHQPGSTQTHVKSRSRPSNERLGSQVQVLNCIRPFQALHGQAKPPLNRIRWKRRNRKCRLYCCTHVESGKAATCFSLRSNEAAGAKSCYNLICLASYIRDASVNIRPEGWMSL